MEYSLGFVFWISIITTVIGAGLIKGAIKSAKKTSPTHGIIHLMSEGMSAVFQRLSSSVIQIILYTSLVLIISATFFNQNLDPSQIVAFFIGGSILILALFLCTTLLPKTLSKVIDVSHNFHTPGISTLINTTFGYGLSLFGVFSLSLIFCIHTLGKPSLIGFGLGISLAAFFLRTSTSLFKTAANISADTVSRLHKKIPQIDKRNPATILDIMSDYIGNIVGYSADFMSSFSFVLIASFIVPQALAAKGILPTEYALQLELLPILVLGISLITALASFLFSHFRIKTKNTSNLLLEGLYLAIGLSALSIFFMIGPFKYASHELFIPYIFGFLGAILIGFSSEYLSSNRFKPTKQIARHVENGAVISFFNSLAIGLKSNAFFLLYILLMLIPAFYYAGIYGITLTALGMLSVAPSILITRSFRPLSTATHKLNQLSDPHPNVLKNTQKLSQLGETTVALGTGFSAGVSILATISIFSAVLIQTSSNINDLFTLRAASLPALIAGMILPLVFSGSLLKRLGQLVVRTNKEVIRQFKEIPFLREDKAKPDMCKISEENARFSNDALIIPACIMTLPPIAIGFILGTDALIAFALGTVLTGLSQSFQWAIAGESAGNARHYIESGHYGGKESPTFTHILTVDNIGDAFKDLLSPSMTTYIKGVTIITALLLLVI